MEMQLIPETELESFETHTRHPQQDMVYWHAFVHALYSRSAEEPPVNEWVLRETGVAVKGPLMLLKLKSRRDSAYPARPLAQLTKSSRPLRMSQWQVPQWQVPPLTGLIKRKLTWKRPLSTSTSRR